MEKRKIVSVIIVCVVVLLLGIAILGQRGGGSYPVPSQGVANESPAVKQMPAPVSGDTIGIQFMRAGASQKERNQFMDGLLALAKTSGTVEIADRCRITPPVLSLKHGENFSAHNNSSRRYTLSFDKTHEYPVDPGATVVIRDVTGSSGLGSTDAIGYKCAEAHLQEGWSAGILYVTK